MNPTKEDPQGIGSVITYMRRYALQAMSGLEAEDDDGNHACQPSASPKPKLNPLPAGSFKPAETASTPKAGPVTTNYAARPQDQMTTSWKDVICHIGTKGGKVERKKLVNLAQTSIDWIKGKLDAIQEPSQQDNLLKAALAMREAEMAPSGAQTELGSDRVNLDALRAKAEAAKIPLNSIATVSRTLGGASKDFDEIPEDEAGHLVAGWTETLNLAKDELDQLPK